MENSRPVEHSETPDWNSLFERFVKEKRLLKRVTDRTIGNYKDAWKAFQKYGKTDVSAQGVKNFMMEMIESGIKPGAASSYARSINSVLTWLFENGHTGETHFIIPLPKLEKRVPRTYTPDEVSRMLSYKPETFGERRLIALLNLLVDTGARIEEALTLTRDKIDFNARLVTFYGKGRKERQVPFSANCGAVLRQWLTEHKHDLVFCSENGTKADHSNLKRDFGNLLKKVGVKKSEGVFHAFRRYFAREYVRNGGNLFYLQKMLGHTSLEMTRRYAELDVDDLRKKHQSASPLANLNKPRKTDSNKREDDREGTHQIV